MAKALGPFSRLGPSRARQEGPSPFCLLARTTADRVAMWGLGRAGLVLGRGTRIHY